MSVLQALGSASPLSTWSGYFPSITYTITSVSLLCSHHRVAFEFGAMVFMHRHYLQPSNILLQLDSQYLLWVASQPGAWAMIRFPHAASGTNPMCILLQMVNNVPHYSQGFKWVHLHLHKSSSIHIEGSKFSWQYCTMEVKLNLWFLHTRFMQDSHSVLWAAVLQQVDASPHASFGILQVPACH